MSTKKVFDYVDAHQNEFIEKLKEWISFKTVSSLSECRKYCFDFVEHVKKDLEEAGVKVRIVPNPCGKQTFANGQVVDYPPLILGEKFESDTKKTLLIYGHLDVQPAQKEDGWSTQPFELTVKDDAMYGRGSTDDKGPVLGWILLLKVLKTLKLNLGLNLKFLFESMEESGSQGISEILNLEKNAFFKGVDYVCISDNYWLGTKKPCITYGLRGRSCYSIEVSGPNCDLHSGVFGGTIHEPMTDLISLMSKLVDNKGNILVPHISDEVAPVTPEEKKIYTKIDFSLDDYVSSVGCVRSHLIHDSKESTLMHRWRFPTLSLHGIQGAFSGEGDKTVIPCKVIGKFSIRLVPNMTSSHLKKCVEEYVSTLVKQLNSPNKIIFSESVSAPAWVSDYNNVNYASAIKATKQIYGVEPDLTREGGSIPIALEFEDILKVNVMLLPMGRGDDGAHSQNEKLNISNFIKGIKLFFAYLHEMSISA